MANAAVDPPLAAVELQPSTARGVFANREFRYLTGGTLFAQLGQWVQNLGQGWLVYQLTNSALQLSLVAVCGGAGMFLIGPIGGAASDRLDRRKLMIASQLAVTGIAVILAVLVYTGWIRVWHIYATAFLSSAAFSFNNPVRMAVLNDVVERRNLPKAIALNSILSNGTRVVGPSLGGALIAAIGVEGTYAAQAGLTLGAVGMTYALQGNWKPHVVDRAGYWDSVMAGFRYIRSDSTLFILIMLSAATAILGWPWQQLMPAYAREALGANEREFGILMSTIGVGAILGGILMVALNVGQSGRLLVGAIVAVGMLLMALGLTHVFALSIVWLLLLGLCGNATLALTQTLMQLRVSDEYRGRVMALWFVLFGLQPIGALPAGAIADTWGIGWGIFATGALLVAIMAVAIKFSCRLRAL